MFMLGELTPAFLIASTSGSLLIPQLVQCNLPHLPVLGRIIVFHIIEVQNRLHLGRVCDCAENRKLIPLNVANCFLEIVHYTSLNAAKL